jgi:hypothetical protein
MGKQIEFIIDDKLEQSFYEYLLSEDFIFYVRNDNNFDEIKAFPQPLSIDFWYSIILYKRNFGEITIKETKNNIRYIDKLVSPIIEYSRCVISENNKTISKCRLWVELSYYNDNKCLINKSKDLDNAFNVLSKWVKNNLTKKEIKSNGNVYKLYISDVIKNFIESNNYSIV